MKLIRLTESDLHRIVRESVSKLLKEMDTFSYDINDYRDIATTNGISGFSDVRRIYDELNRYLHSNKEDWDFLHLTDWANFINRLKDVPQRMRFETSKRSGVSQDVYDKVVEFAKNAEKIPHPDLWVGSNTSFAEKAESVKGSLEYAYKVYGDFIDYLVSTHENADMKQQDIEADWKKFDKTRNDLTNKMKNKGETEQLYRQNNPFSRSQKRNALKRYDIVANPEDEKNKEYHDMLMSY